MAFGQTTRSTPISWGDAALAPRYDENGLRPKIEFLRIAQRASVNSFVYALIAIGVTADLCGCGQIASEAPVILSGVDPARIERHGQLFFLNDVKLGCHLATQQQMPCLFFFTAQWCTFCHRMAETAFNEPAVGELGRNFICILVDADREPQLCRYFSVTGFPTVEFVSPDGHSLHRLVGQQSPANVAAGMRAALGRYAWVSESQLR